MKILLPLPSPYFICVYGPTAVGKTAFVQELAKQLPIEIVNMDVGQFYTPLTIGTAKPEWQQEPVWHHMFDIKDTPDDYSAVMYRSHMQKLIPEIWSRGHIPVLVGGSGFYLHNMIFPVSNNDTPLTLNDYQAYTTQDLWQKLHIIDAQRAAQIHTNDRYRITRALDVFAATGNKPSEQLPTYNPLFTTLIIELTRDRIDLYERINMRTQHMMQNGWLQEVDVLRGSEWEQFIKRKGLIGYTTLFDQKDVSSNSDTIAQHTRNYAKRQGTFGRMLAKKLTAVKATMHQEKPTHFYSCNLTFTPLDLYLKQLIEWNL